MHDCLDLELFSCIRVVFFVNQSFMRELAIMSLHQNWIFYMLVKMLSRDVLMTENSPKCSRWILQIYMLKSNLNSAGAYEVIDANFTLSKLEWFVNLTVLQTQVPPLLASRPYQPLLCIFCFDFAVTLSHHYPSGGLFWEICGKKWTLLRLSCEQQH